MYVRAKCRYYISALRLQVREKITQWCHEKYMRPKEMIFYKAWMLPTERYAFSLQFSQANKVGQKIDNCDHQITSDVERFSDVFAERGQQEVVVHTHSWQPFFHGS